MDNRKTEGKGFLDAVDSGAEIGALLVHLIDKEEGGDVFVFNKGCDSFSLVFYPGNRADWENNRIRHP